MTSSAYNEKEKQMLAAARRLRLAVFKDIEQSVCVPATESFLGALNPVLRKAVVKTPAKAALVASCVRRLVLAKDPSKLAKTAKTAQDALTAMGFTLQVDALVADARSRVGHDSPLIEAMQQIEQAQAELQALRDLV